MAFMKKYNSGRALTDGEIIYCLSSLDKYLSVSVPDAFVEKRLKVLNNFKSKLIAERRLRKINSIL